MDTSPDQFVSSAITLLIVGSLTSIAYWLYNQATDWFYRQFLVTITVKKPDATYYWIAAYLSEHRHELYSASNLTLSVDKEKAGFGRRHAQDDEDDDIAKQGLKLLPGEGLHVFQYKGKYVWLTRTIGQPVQQGLFGKPIISESITVSMIGRSTKNLEALFMDAYKAHKEEQDGKTRVFILEDGWYWKMASCRKPRSLESVVLDGTTAQDIITDVKDFMKSEPWYRGCGIPFRRGYLLHGPPGTGKTSFIQAIAGELGLNICVVNLSNKSLDDESLNSRLIEAPAKSIILLEDIDAVFVGRSAAGDFSKKSSSSVTFSGLLNALDGVASQEGRVMFMTTNHIEKLDPALIRPGRCDYIVKFDLASANQARRMFLRFFPEEKDLANDVKTVLAERSVSPASLQGHFLKHRKQPLEALRTLKSLLKTAQAKKVGEKAASAIQIGMWLKRLALPEHYGHKLARMKVVYVSDLYQLEAGDVISLMDIKNELHKARVQKFFDNDVLVKQAYALQKTNTIQDLFIKYNPDAKPEQIAEFAKLCPPDELSAYEIENYLARYIENPKKALHNIDNLIESADVRSHSDLLRRSTLRSQELTVNEWLDQMGQAQAKEKFKEAKIDDMEQVLEFGEGDLGEFGIEKKGDQWRCAQDLARRKAQLELCA